MSKLIFAVNITADGCCDHRAAIIDTESNAYYNDLVTNAGAVLFGANTFKLFREYWPAKAKEKTGLPEEVRFAELINGAEKIVFSKSMKNPKWDKTVIVRQVNAKIISALKTKFPSGLFLIGSPGLAEKMIRKNLVDEYIFCVHPLIAGEGMKFFKKGKFEVPLRRLKLKGSKTFQSGVTALEYENLKSV